MNPEDVAKKTMMIKKNIYLIAGVLLIMQMIGCRAIDLYSNISEQPPYKELIGQDYIILKDFYLCRKGKGPIVTLSPCGVAGLPQKLDKRNIGNIINDWEIVGIVPKHSSFTLVKVDQYNLDYITMILPIIKISSQYNDVQAFWLFKGQLWNMELVKGPYPENYYKTKIIGKWEFKRNSPNVNSHVLEEYSADGKRYWSGIFTRSGKKQKN